MADPNHTYYNVKVELDPIADDNGSNKVVIWNSGSSEFDLADFNSSDICFPYTYETDTSVNNGECQLRETDTPGDITTDPSVATILKVSSIPNNGVNLNNYLSQVGNGIVTIRQNNIGAAPSFGIYQVTNISGTTGLITFTIDLLAYNGTFTDNANVNACFIPQDQCTPKIKVGPQFPLENEPTASQYGMFSRTNNSGCSEVSGSDSFLIQGISGSGFQDTESIHQEIHARRGGPTGETLAFHSEVPIRMQYASQSDIYPQAQPVEYASTTNYPSQSYSTVPVSYEYIFATRSGALTAGQKTNFADFSLSHGYIGSSSYTATDSVNIFQNFSYAKINHTAIVGQASIQRTQVCTHHVAWSKNSSGNLSGLTVNSIEEVRTPLNQVIIDPSLTTASFDVDGFNLSLSIYHYDVDYAYHVFKYTLI